MGGSEMGAFEVTFARKATWPPNCPAAASRTGAMSCRMLLVIFNYDINGGQKERRGL